MPFAGPQGPPIQNVHVYQQFYHPRNTAAALNALITAATESMGGESIAEKRLMLSVCRLRSRNSFTSGGGPCECKPLPICSLGGEKTFPRDFSKKNVLP